MVLKKVKTYQSIFFDLDNTLWDFNKNSYEALRIAFNKFGLNSIIPDFELFYNTFKHINEKYWEKYRENEISKKQLIIKRFEDTFQEFGISINTLSFNDEYLSIMPEINLLVENAYEVLEYLKNKRYTLYIITNGFREVQYKKLEKSGIAHFFKRVFISEDIQCQKPGKEIFEHALKSTNSRKKSSIMIGDSWDVDIQGALKMGIDQVYFNPDEPEIIVDINKLIFTKQTKTYTFRINNLKQLTTFL